MRKCVDRWQTSFLMWDYSIPGWIYAVPPSKNLRNENADTCQAMAFLCLHIFILLYVNIIPKATDAVKKTTVGMQGHKCNAFDEKGVAAQQLFEPFFDGECKHTRVSKTGL